MGGGLVEVGLKMKLKHKSLALFFGVFTLGCGPDEERYCYTYSYAPENNNIPECPDLEQMRKKWVGKQWGDRGTVQGVKSGPEIKSGTNYTTCCYTFEM